MKEAIWAYKENEWRFWWECSSCGRKPSRIRDETYFSPFCPHCGCFMTDVEKRHEIATAKDIDKVIRGIFGDMG